MFVVTYIDEAENKGYNDTYGQRESLFEILVERKKRAAISEEGGHMHLPRKY